eukprot:12010633-Prorocentrum_lima.AAC.1
MHTVAHTRKRTATGNRTVAATHGPKPPAVDMMGNRDRQPVRVSYSTQTMYAERKSRWMMDANKA